MFHLLRSSQLLRSPLTTSCQCIRLLRPPVIKIHTSSPRLSFLKRIRKESYYKKADQIPEGYELIYRSPVGHYISAVAHVSTATCIFLGGYVIPMWIQQTPLKETYAGRHIFEAAVKIGGSHLVLEDDNFTMTVMVTGFVAFNILVRLMIHRFPQRIWRKGEEYRAVFQGHLPFLRRWVDFKRGDFRQRKPRRMLGALNEMRYTLKGKKTYLLDNYFRSYSDLHSMLPKGEPILF